MPLQMAAIPDRPDTEQPTSLAVAPYQWIRRAKRSRVVAALALVFAAGWSAIFFGAIENPHLSETTGSYVALGVFFFGGGALGGMYAWRLSRAGVLMSRDGVVVRGPLRTWTVPLADVERFEPGVQPGAGNGTPCPMLKRKNGRAIGVWALGRDGLVWRLPQYLHDLEPLCDELNEVLQTVEADRAR